MLLAPLRAAADLSFYREVPQKRRLWFLGYLSYLGLLFSLAGTVALRARVAPLLQETLDWASRSVPPLTFAGGKATSQAPGPVRLEHPKLEAFAFVIHTARATPVTLEEMQEQKVVAYLTEDSLYLSPTPERLERHDLSRAAAPGSPTVILDERFYRAIGRVLPFVLYPLAYATSWFFFVLWSVALAYVFSLAAMALNAALAAGLDYTSLWKLSLMAQTPATLLRMVQMFLPSPIPMSWLIGLLVSGVYLWQAVRQNAPTAAAAE